MNKSQFACLEVGDMVVITTHGKNKGKMGMVVEIKRNIMGGGIAYLEPFQCEFEFYKGSIRTQNKDGFYAWRSDLIAYAALYQQKSNKQFYIGKMYGEEGVSWSAKNFTDNELGVIERFLKELNENIEGVSVDSIVILDKDDED